MAKVTFNVDICKGCGLCVNACPKQILAISKTTINKKGHFPVEMTDQSHASAAPSALPCVRTASLP